MEKGYNPEHHRKSEMYALEKAIIELLEPAGDDTPEERDIRRRNLRRILETKDLGLDDLKYLIDSFNLKIGKDKDEEKEKKEKGIRPMDIVDALLPKEVEGQKIEVEYRDDSLVDTEGNDLSIKKGSGTFEKKKIIPRTKIITDFLIKNDVKTPIRVISGKNKPGIMRIESYNMIMLPDLQKMILICDEEGNRTFIIDDYSIEPEEYYRLTKKELDELSEVEGLRWSDEKNWKMRLLKMLLSSKEETEKKDRKEKEEFLSFDEFVAEVKTCKINTIDKYREENKEHRNWPSNPDRQYKNKGWVSYRNLFEKELNFLPFDEFVAEVRAMGVNSFNEYRVERKKHLDWPSTPSKYYKAWEKNGKWNGLFGKVEKLIPFLPYDQFKKDVRSTGIQKHGKYRAELKNHPDWPSNPQRQYKNNGWISWKELFGKEEVVFLPFDEFVAEVQASGLTNYKEYIIERKKHPEWKWPSTPKKQYGDAVWEKIGKWNGLFGKK